MKIQLEHREPENTTSEHLAHTLLARFGLLPRKKDGSAQMHKLLLELYERKKKSNREHQPEAAVMPVDDMSAYAMIARQTMYDYLNRWLDLNILKKTSFVSNGKVIIGYELNGPTLESSFRKAETTIKNHLDYSFKLLEDLQNTVKKEKLILSANKKEEHQDQQHYSSPDPDETPHQASQTPHSPHTSSPEEHPSQSNQ